MAKILETELTNLKWCGWQNSRLFEYLERQTWTYEKKSESPEFGKCCQYNNVMSNGKTPVTCQSKWYVSFIDNSRRKIVIKYHIQQVIDRTSVRCEKSGNVSMFKFSIPQYSAIPIFWTTKENENCFENRIFQEIRGEITEFDWREGNDFWFELLGGSKKLGLEKYIESTVGWVWKNNLRPIMGQRALGL